MPTPGPSVPELSPAQCSAKLAELFPALFALQQPLPLKLRIQADIQERAPNTFTRKSLSIFLHRYTTGTPYLQALSRVPQRFDLDGQPAGDVAAEHRDAATTEAARRRSLVQAKRAAEQAAQREAAASARAARGEPTRGETAGAERAPRRGPRRPGAAAPGQAQHGAAAAHPRAEATPETPEQAAQRAAQYATQNATPNATPNAAPNATQNATQNAAQNAAQAAERAARRQAQDAERAARRVAQPETAADTRPRQAPDSDMQGRRERALLLRSYESSTLTRANFCVLKRIAEADLEAHLVQARKEAAERPPVQDERRGPPPPRRDHGQQGERPRRPRPGP